MLIQGTLAGVAIIADYTVSFIGLKTGLFTGSGRACCGESFFFMAWIFRLKSMTG